MAVKTVLITGANGALGSGVVKRFLEEGFSVIAIDGKKNHLAFAEVHQGFEFHAVDLVNEAAVDQLLEELLRKKMIDAGFMLAGGFAMGKIAEATATDMRKMFDLNFFTAYSISRKLYTAMQASGYGRLVFIGARPAMDAGAGSKMAPYAISKAMVIQLAELINAESKGKDITASVIVPTTIDTPANRASMPDADFAKWVKPEQIAELLLMVVSDKGSVLREVVLKLI